MVNLEVAKRLEDLRVQHKLSYAAMGLIAGKSATAAHKWCKIGKIDEENLVALCEEFKVQPAEIRYGILPMDAIAPTPAIQQVVQKMLAMERQEQYKVKKMVDVMSSSASNEPEPNGDHGEGGKRPAKG
jgi:hypothetical protein